LLEAGGGHSSGFNSANANGGNGGGSVGGNGLTSMFWGYASVVAAKGGTSNKGGTAGYNSFGYGQAGENGKFGQGGAGYSFRAGGGGGGGGWFGGGGGGHDYWTKNDGSNDDASGGGGGGSGYVGGVTNGTFGVASGFGAGTAMLTLIE